MKDCCIWEICLLALVCFVGCDRCDSRGRAGGNGMCGACVQSVDCMTGLSCVNGACETAPLSCHVKIGL